MPDTSTSPITIHPTADVASSARIARTKMRELACTACGRRHDVDIDPYPSGEP